MPLYVYGCPRCDVVSERLRPSELADFPPVECPVCHGLMVREIAQVNVLRGVPEPVARDDPDAHPDAVNLLHEPGCPCCRRSA